ncbi:MAG: ComF family protein [Candidatus Zambryskibacteria bacterium]|nr:ComF family protein [Candidatus Zambryskibacteria bacterium]
MLKSLRELLLTLLDFFLPERRDFTVVKKLDENSLISLPKAPQVVGFDWIHPLFHYKDDRVRAIIWELKYRENTLPLENIGKLLYEEILSVISEISLFDSDASFVLLPVPITPERRTERGYNQSEHIAKSVLENDIEHILLYAPQWFEKVFETPKQSRSESKSERMKNLLGCFRADNRLEGKYIILIDDVVTTGSTLLEARNTLMKAGVKDVLAFTIAH